MSFTDLGLLGMVLILGFWVFQLKLEMRRLSDGNDCKPPEIPPLTVRDMQLLQSSLAELVSEVEQYTESQLRKMATQTQTLQVLCKRLEDKLQQKEEREAAAAQDPPAFVLTPPAPSPPAPVHTPPTRIVPLSPRQGMSNHKDRDRIMELHRKGLTPDKIAEELRITKGEVQLVVNLA
jgi:hypothetical protein